MTIEETIKGLTSLLEVRKKYGDMQTMKDEIECLDMGIQALTAISELSKSLKAVNRYDMDEKVLIGFNMAVAIFNKYFGESGESCALKNEPSEQNVGMCQQNVGEMSEKQTDGDLISRQAVLDLFGDIHPMDYNAIAYVTQIKKLPSAEKTDGDLIAEIDKLPRIKVGNSNSPTVKYCIDEVLLYDLFENYKAEKTAEWIPVKDRMPEFNDIVLASTDSDYDELRVILTVYKAEEFWFNGTIKAWMPIPKPYKVK